MSFRLPPSEESTPLLRTDYAREDRWRSLLAAIATPTAEGFLANVSTVTDPVLDGLTDDEVRALPAADDGPMFVLVADETAQADDEFPILVVDTSAEARPSFRVAGRCLWAVENNLSLANMDWEEFADTVDSDNVYRNC